MEDTDCVPLSKKTALKNESKCVRCKILIHKTTGTSKTITTCDSYDYFVQLGDVICFKCRS